MLSLPCQKLATIRHPLSPAQVNLLQAVENSIHLVSIGPTHCDNAPGIRRTDTILGTIHESSLTWPGAKRDYLVQLARIAPDKGQELSIAVAKRLGLPLVLGGFVGAAEQGYFEEKVKPWLGKGVEWQPDIRGDERARVLSEARVLLFPIQWDEPFGTAMAEAMASGTPVVATPRAAALDVVEPGITGFLAQTEDEFVEAVRAVEKINPIACAKRARERFGGERFAVEYEALYRRIVGQVVV
jgi:glycosyltransferase involved in cell wall biosynthesis